MHILSPHFTPEGQVACLHFSAIAWSAKKNVLCLYLLGPMYLSGASRYIKMEPFVGYTLTLPAIARLLSAVVI